MARRVRRYLGLVLRAFVGFGVGWCLADLIADSASLRFVAGLVGLFIAVNPVVAAIIPGAFRKPEGGYLPLRIKSSARNFDRALIASRIALRRAAKGQEGEIVQTARRVARKAAADATVAASADIAREIVLFREPCKGPPHIQAAWVGVIAAAREGIAEAEASADHDPDD